MFCFTILLKKIQKYTNSVVIKVLLFCCFTILRKCKHRQKQNICGNFNFKRNEGSLFTSKYGKASAKQFLLRKKNPFKSMQQGSYHFPLWFAWKINLLCFLFIKSSLIEVLSIVPQNNKKSFYFERTFIFFIWKKTLLHVLNAFNKINFNESRLASW